MSLGLGVSDPGAAVGGRPRRKALIEGTWCVSYSSLGLGLVTLAQPIHERREALVEGAWCFRLCDTRVHMQNEPTKALDVSVARRNFVPL